MKRLLLLVIACLTLSGVFAQQSVDLDLKEKKTVPITLTGPAQSDPVKLLLDVTYQPDEKTVKVVMKYDKSKDGPHISSPNKKTKDQITHLLFLFDWNGLPYKNVNFKSYFKGAYNSKIILETPIQEQIANCNYTDFIRSAFEINNGEIENKSENNIVFSVDKGELVLMIKEFDLNKPVELTINNVIPLSAKNEGQLQSNKYWLKYISNSATIIFNFPECARQYDLIRQYESLNKTIKDDYGKLLNYEDSLQKNNVSDEKGIIERQWHLLYKYDEARKGINHTECDLLQQQFDVFNDYYGRIIDENALTPDSLRKMIEELILLDDSLYYASDGFIGTCENLKEKAAQYFDVVELEEDAFDPLSEAYELVHQFNELKEDIEEYICPAREPKVIDSLWPLPIPPVVRDNCADDIRSINKATGEIVRMITQWHKNHHQKHKKKFDETVSETDKIINNLPKSCQDRYKDKINEYKAAKKNYEKHVK